ncbi:MAG: hypothetical protein AABP62_21055 [Planctomycetota bacterium]
MRRLYWFWSSLPMAARLQFFVLALILGYNFVAIDLSPANRLFGAPFWMTTVPLIVTMIAVGRLLLPLMMAYPLRAQQVLHGFGLAVFGVWLLSQGQWWGRSVIVYLSLIAGLWLEAACSFWFVSEVGRRQELMLAQMSELLAAHSSLPDDEIVSHDDDLTEESR